jgi:hypothetical protein
MLHIGLYGPLKKRMSDSAAHACKRNRMDV